MWNFIQALISPRTTDYQETSSRPFYRKWKRKWKWKWKFWQWFACYWLSRKKTKIFRPFYLHGPHMSFRYARWSCCWLCHLSSSVFMCDVMMWFDDVMMWCCWLCHLFSSVCMYDMMMWCHVWCDVMMWCRWLCLLSSSVCMCDAHTHTHTCIHTHTHTH